MFWWLNMYSTCLWAKKFKILINAQIVCFASFCGWMFIQRLINVLFSLLVSIFFALPMSQIYLADWNYWPIHIQRLMCVMICFYRIQFWNWNWQCGYFGAEFNLLATNIVLSLWSIVSFVLCPWIEQKPWAFCASIQIHFQNHSKKHIICV